ncbi:MAG: hypothetical protein ACUVX8_10615 [Candidatus Zipacnadales bacterium]
MSRQRQSPQLPPSSQPPCLSRWPIRIAATLGLATLGLGLLAALVQPWQPEAPGAQHRVPPDETAHLEYIRYLMKHRSLPVLKEGGGNYEAHQPPLYYLTCLPLAALGHTPDPHKPARGIPPAEVIPLRLWSVLIAAGVVLACYLVARVVFPAHPLLQVAAPAFALLLPGHLINLAAVTNDGLAELFCCLAIWLMVSLIRKPTVSLRQFAWLGLVMGAALLTKTSCLFLLPVGLVAVVMASRQTGQLFSGRRFFLHLLASLGLALLLWLPWILHNLRHYPGDPLVMRTFVRIFSVDRATPDTFLAQGMSPWAYLRLVFLWTYLSFWGVFGQALVFLPDWCYLIGTLLTVLSVLGGMRRLRGWRTASREARSIWSLFALAVILVVLQFLQFNMTFFQAQARYIFPAIAPLACGFVAGLAAAGELIAGHKKEKALLIPSGLALALILMVSLTEVAQRGPVAAPDWLL